MADNYQVKDASGSNITIRAKEVTAGQYSNRIIPQVSDTDVSTSNPLPVSAPFVGDSILIGSTLYTVKRAYVDASSSGSTQVVAAVTSKKIRVLSYELVTNGAVNIHFRSNATQISSTKYAPQAGWGIARSHNFYGYFETTAGDALNVNLSTAVAVGVQITYIEV